LLRFAMRPTMSGHRDSIADIFCLEYQWVRFARFQCPLHAKRGGSIIHKLCPEYQWVRLLDFESGRVLIDRACPYRLDRMLASMQVRHLPGRPPSRLVSESSSVAILVVGEV